MHKQHVILNVIQCNIDLKAYTIFNGILFGRDVLYFPGVDIL